MKDSKFVKSMLIISGLLLIFIGASYLFTPIEFYASANQTDISGQVNLLSEIRAAGGGLLLGGILVAVGAFKSHFAYTATVISIMIWMGWGLARIVGFAADGMPNEGLVIATICEILIGIWGIIAIKKYAVTPASI
ncbi:DUF4345 domain-containing protein [Alteromonas sp. a30]|uniref:DUF4345 domain-containing protein n=1 Tax=Alteromonas sp. a30 TaxID=2730917 RepID=UPI0022803868|nr:DUF4345 domain-containing protein [Alteromonas sp. a30]MCY7296490.1 DUF4345 domain-containing protein [Alteromonas sp. a30]